MSDHTPGVCPVCGGLLTSSADYDHHDEYCGQRHECDICGGTFDDSFDRVTYEVSKLQALVCRRVFAESG
ncbi:unnamed protein product [marine sediment metagenome]|uniref:Transcription factor zinc-finger domain-containing protein n=1 Tax=marine sediment metagenome TaxID=412755 RepID=X0W4E4_9ZZZZ